MAIAATLRTLFPEQARVSSREKLVSALGAFLGISLVVLVSQVLAVDAHRPIVIASMGASAVLLFGVHHSPLSQPWAFVGGHLISAAIGIACAAVVPDLYLAGGLAVGLAVFAMYWLRCLHPPGGASALLGVIGSGTVHSLGGGYVLTLVAANLVAMLLAAWVVNNLSPGRRYPMNRHGAATPAASRPTEPAPAEREDVMAALESLDAFIDVTEADMERILRLAAVHRQKRLVGALRCRDIMSREVVVVERETSLAQTWDRLRRHGIRGMPVVDADRRIVGMVAISDFLRQTGWTWERQRPLSCLLPRREAPRTAGEIMSSPVIKVGEDTHVADLLLLFADHGINHIPVVGSDGRLSGIVTRLDMLNLFFREGEERAAA